jgi:hypothetical protein
VGGGRVGGWVRVFRKLVIMKVIEHGTISPTKTFAIHSDSYHSSQGYCLRTHRSGCLSVVLLRAVVVITASVLDPPLQLELHFSLKERESILMRNVGLRVTMVP